MRAMIIRGIDGTILVNGVIATRENADEIMGLINKAFERGYQVNLTISEPPKVQQRLPECAARA
jgi:hypothetical protein